MAHRLSEVREHRPRLVTPWDGMIIGPDQWAAIDLGVAKPPEYPTAPPYGD